MKRALFCLALSAAAFAADTTRKSGVDRDAMDLTCKPCDDFYRYANGTWLDKNPIPARYSNWGSFSLLQEANRERLKTILESAALAKDGSASARKIGDLYAACMDTAALNSLGDKPLRPDLERIAAISDLAALKSTILSLQSYGFVGPFSFGAPAHLKNTSDTIAGIGPAGLSLPDRDYYFNNDERTTKIREEFVGHVQRMLQLLGDAPEQAAASAKVVLEFETDLAGKIMTRVQRRDPYASYHKMDLQGVSQLAPGIDWKALLKSFQVAESTAINVAEPEHLKFVDQQLTAVPLDQWKTWLRWRVLTNSAALLSTPFVEENFRFEGAVLTGAKEQLPRWQTCTNSIDRLMGEALGELFVEKHFPPAAKQRMNQLVENLRAALREELESAAWLTPETKKNAVAKLNAFKAKIGYPDKWRDYSPVQVNRRDFFGSVRSAALYARKYQVAKIGKPVDKTEWGMTPPTVNAYYRPTWNEIAFPAGILQWPFFELEADDAVNYGAIGAVIGHEMGHGFDDQGSKFDAEGNLRNWWTPEDRKKFEERAACIVDQYNTFDVGPGLRHNGKLVVGEALGDIGGLTLAYKAYRRSLRNKPEPPALDGFTADQRFFLSFARVWARSHTPEDLRLRLNTDPHPIARYRAIGTLQNMPEFHQAFQCKQGDAMVRPAEKQCRLW